MWRRRGIAVLAMAMMSACAHTPHEQIREEARTQALEDYAEAYKRGQFGNLLHEPKLCEVNDPAVVMLPVPSGLHGPIYMAAHEIPIFVEKATLDGRCIRQ